MSEIMSETREQIKKARNYSALLEKLPLEFNPRSRKWREYVPHLPDAKLADLLKAKGVACPAILIDGVANALIFTRCGKNISVTYDSASGSSMESDLGFDEAVLYARSHHLPLFQTHEVANVFRILLQDPRDLRVSRQVVWAALDRGLDFIKDNHSAPQSKLINEAILYAGENMVAGSELSAARRAKIKDYAYCSLCGWAYSGNRCRGCEEGFIHDKYNVSVIPIGDCCGPEGVMPRKAFRAFEEAGHVFTLPHEEMAAKEEKEWRDWQEHLGGRRKRQCGASCRL